MHNFFSTLFKKESPSANAPPPTQGMPKASPIAAVPSSLKAPFSLDPIQTKLYEAIELTKGNFYIQGQAGTGKSSFVQYSKEHTRKRFCVVSPPAVAAMNMGGVTIHSMFMLPFSDFFILDKLELKSKTEHILRKIDTLIIDEVPMVRPDTGLCSFLPPKRLLIWRN